ncbi:hypothetical protein B0H19DRAFT_1239755 [Mycena capillaripes]|nr:hypothetical protein B0H19DRAFT_1239755 [Mycena capillaripes]
MRMHRVWGARCVIMWSCMWAFSGLWCFVQSQAHAQGEFFVVEVKVKPRVVNGFASFGPLIRTLPDSDWRPSLALAASRFISNDEDKVDVKRTLPTPRHVSDSGAVKLDGSAMGHDFCRKSRLNASRLSG